MAESHREEIAKLEALYAGNPGGRVFVHLAEAYRKSGEHERARRILDEGLARHTDSASGYVVLGRVLADMQIGEEAEVAFRRVLELDSGNLVALRWLGDLARQSGRLSEAVAHYRELLTRNPSNEEVRDLVEIVEREATGVERPPPPPAEPEWHEPEPVEQVPEAPEEGLTPLSAAPGRTGDEEPAEVEYGLVEIQGLEEEVRAEPATDVADEDLADSVVIESLAEVVDEAEQELSSLSRTDEAEPLEIHLLDPSFTGAEAEEEEYAGDDFIADLLNAAPAPQAPDALDAGVDVLDVGAALTLQDTPTDAGMARAEADDASGETMEASWTPSVAEPGSFPPPLTPHGDELGAAAASEHAAPLTPAPVSTPEEASTPALEPAAAAPVADVQQEETAPEPAAAAPVPDVWQEEEDAPEPAGDTAHVAPALGMLDRMDAMAADFADEPETAAAAATPQPEAAPQEAPAVEQGSAEAGPEPGLLTETMAELYRAQGFHERAAEVYRALLRQRPFDLRLSARLSEAEADAAAAAAAERAAAAPARDEEEPSGEVWLRGVGASWDAGSHGDPEGATPYAWTPEPEEPAAGNPIGGYLRELVSWRTGQQRWSEAQPEPPQVAAPPESGPAKAPQLTPWSPEDEPWATAPAGDPAGAGTGAGATGWPAAVERPEIQPRAEESAPFEADPAGGQAAPSSAPNADPADPWLQAAPGSAAPAPASRLPENGAEPDAWTAPESTEMPAQQPEPDTEDEDLEMFRSWLQSLKK